MNVVTFERKVFFKLHYATIGVVLLSTVCLRSKIAQHGMILYYVNDVLGYKAFALSVIRKLFVVVLMHVQS